MRQISLLAEEEYNPRKLAAVSESEANLKALDIAAEMYLARNIGIYYIDIMRDIDTKQFASSYSVLAWFRDRKVNTKDGGYTREGIISLYKKDYPCHFNEEGGWHASYLPLYINYACKRLVDPSYNKGKHDLYEASIMDTSWFDKLVTMAGILMFESVDVNTLASNAAKQTFLMNQGSRELLGKIGAISGRIAKYHDYELIAELKEEITDHLYSTQKAINALIQSRSDELEYLEEYGQVYDKSLTSVRSQLYLV